MRTFGFLVLLVLLALIVLILVVGRTHSSPPPSRESYPGTETEESPRSGIARCRYRGYTPILTCSYQAFS
jgi:hypothetical protein